MLEIIPPVIYSLSSIAALVFAAAVIRRVLASNTETYSSRILLTVSVVNTLSCCLLLSGMSLLYASDAVLHGRLLSADTGIAALVLMLPGRVLFEFATGGTRRYKQLRLAPAKSKSLHRSIERLARELDIPVPKVLATPYVTMPFVFGRSSASAYLIVPSHLESQDEAILLHELAHIRNRDVGFLTWAFCFRQQFWLIPIVLALMILLSGLRSPAALTPVLHGHILYLCYLISLWLLYARILRERELLADHTAASLLGVDHMAATIRRHISGIQIGSHGRLRYNPRSSVGHRIRQWLSDKVMFGKNGIPWHVLDYLLAYISMTHPRGSERIAAMERRSHNRNPVSLKKWDCFWAGTSIGFMGTLISLSGLWLINTMLDAGDDWSRSTAYSATILLVLPWALCLTMTLLVIPMFASATGPRLTPTYAGTLAIRYLVAILGCCSASVLTIAGGWPEPETIRTCFVTTTMFAAVLLAAFAATALVPAAWGRLFYVSRSDLADLLKTCQLRGGAILLLLIILFLGLFILCTTEAWLGGSLVISAVIGLAAHSAITGKSHVSTLDEYCVLSIRPWLRRIDTKEPNALTLLVYGGITSIVSTLCAFLTFLVLCGITRPFAATIPFLAWFAILDVVAGTVLLVQDRHTNTVVGSGRLRQIYTLHRTLACTRYSTSVRIEERIGVLLAKRCNAKMLRTAMKYSVPTPQLMFELASLTMGRHSPEWLAESRERITNCNQRGGFGPWPEMNARLSSTYYALAFLKQAGFPDAFPFEIHGDWIRQFQHPAGYFRGANSGRSEWEDTFFAVASLDMLGSHLDEKARVRCLAWVRVTLIHKGIEKGHLDAFHYCLATAEILHGLDQEMANCAGQRLSLELDRLLLTNVPHNAENVHHAVCAYYILKERGISLFHPDRMDLLADRIAAALEAELAALRI